MASFKNRLLILIVSLMALAQGVTIVLALASIRSAVRADSARQLTATRAMLDSTFAERARLLRAAADVLVADFGFREVIATTDRATMQSARPTISSIERNPRRAMMRRSSSATRSGPSLTCRPRAS